MKKPLSMALVLLSYLMIPLSPLTAQHRPVPLGSSAAPFGYYEYLPLGYDSASNEEWPVVIFLHGADESGNGTTQLGDILVTGLTKNVEDGTQYPFVMISPQSPGIPWNVGNLDTLVQFVKSNYHVNEDRIYLTGLSMGGIGTWNYAKSNPEELAAILPLCGAPSGTPNGAALVNVPTWAFHAWGDTKGGANPDYTVNWIESLAAALGGGPLLANYPGTYTGPPGPGNESDKDRTASLTSAAWTWKDGISQVAGSQPTLTLYHDKSHNCWTRTYNNSAPLKWLLAQNRHGATNRAPAVTLTAPATNQTFNNPTSVTITAGVTDGDGTISRVEFYAGNQLLGTDNTPPHQRVWSNPPAGVHWITVKATDDDNTVGVQVVKITVKRDSTLELITPAGAGKATGSLFFPMEFAFDGPPSAVDPATGEPSGGVNASDAPGYSSRTGYIDFGPEWYKVRIAQTWTKYRVSSAGNQAPYAALWWDDDFDNVNDSGLTESQVNFNTAQNLATDSTEPWLKDRDLTANPVAPRARYLLCLSSSAMTGRAKEYALVGWIDPNALPPSP
jgi:poly(3-hydroxybutyrate) depolymerase